MKSFKEIIKTKAFKALLVILILVIISTSIAPPAEKKEAKTLEYCKSFDTFKGCLSNGCYIANVVNIPFLDVTECMWGWVNNAIPTNLGGCKNKADANDNFLAGSNPGGACPVGYKAVKSGSDYCMWWGAKPLYICVEDENPCNSAEQPVANMIDSVWKDNTLDCKTKYYMTLGAGFMIAIMMISVI